MLNFVDYETIQKKMDSYGYVATKELVWNAVRLVNKMYDTIELQKGQDISAICLDGPPGSGKTEFAKIMLKLYRDLIDKDAVMIDYQCDPTTTKTELFEDINAAAAVAGDPSKVIVDGALLKAISAVNEGKRVILFLDEYDKAREETDAFLLQFLQSGQISTTQKNNAKIEDDSKKKNLQVILCKNDNREQLSGPLERRLQFIRLKEMEPKVFFTVANKKFPNEKGYVSLVSLIYEIMYKNKVDFNRIPACSEMLMAIDDAVNYEKWNAPNDVIYKSIIDNMVKDDESKPILYNLLKNSKRSINIDLSSLSDENNTHMPNVYDLINNKVVKEQENKYKDIIRKLEEERETYLDGSNVKINKEIGLKQTNQISNTLSNFPDNTGKIRRGKSCFSGSKNWTKIVSISSDDLDVDNYLTNMSNAFLKDKKGVLYENGFRLNLAENTLKINYVRSEIVDKEGNISKRLEIYSSLPVIPAVLYNEILIKLYNCSECFGENIDFKLNSLIYNGKEIPSCTKIVDNVYHYDYQNKKNATNENITNENINNAMKVSIKNVAEEILRYATREWDLCEVNKIGSALLGEGEDQECSLV